MMMDSMYLNAAGRRARRESSDSGVVTSTCGGCSRLNAGLSPVRNATVNPVFWMGVAIRRYKSLHNAFVGATMRMAGPFPVSVCPMADWDRLARVISGAVRPL